jgi:hypothetical protein
LTRIVPARYESIIGPTSALNPRNGEGAIVALKDDHLLLGWTHFTGGRHDHSPADIHGRVSKNGGYAWGEPFLLQENVGAQNVMSVGLLRLQSGDLLFGYAIKHHASQDCRYYVRRSADEGANWFDPVLATPEDGYFVVNNDRLVQTRSGRLLVPVAKAVDARYHCVSGCFYSDDEGITWQRGPQYIDLSGVVGLQEPGILECADGSLWMYMRTDYGYIFSSRSYDDGVSWSAAQATELVAPISPATAKRLPDSDDILMIYNDRRGVPFDSDWHSQFNWRTPLSSAVSDDCGRTWGHHKLVEEDRHRSYCYTSITFLGDATLLTYYVGVAGGPNLLDMKLKIVPTSSWTA